MSPPYKSPPCFTTTYSVQEMHFSRSLYLESLQKESSGEICLSVPQSICQTRVLCPCIVYMHQMHIYEQGHRACLHAMRETVALGTWPCCC